MRSGRISPPLKSMKAEWMACPRCQNKKLKPEVIGPESQGAFKLWWVCENYANCMFPLDMPANIFYVTQSAYQKKQGYIPLPNILAIPEKYRYMYPITFSDSRPVSRCSSMAPTKANSRNETSDSSDATSIASDKSSGLNRLKADDFSAQSAVSTSSLAPSSSDPSEIAADQDIIDEELEAAGKERPPVRTVRVSHKRKYERSWASVIEKVASDPVASDKIINMEETELFSRMKEFFEDPYFRGSALSYKRKERRLAYRAEDVEDCLRTVTKDEWESARKNVPRLTAYSRAIQAADTKTLLKHVGIDVQQRKRAIGEKVGSVMKEFNNANNQTKRRKYEEKREQEQKKKEQNLQNEIHLSVSARILNRKRLRDEEGRSQASTPSCSSERCTPAPPSLEAPEPHERQGEAPRAVQFQVGNDEESSDAWGFDFNGLYDTIHAENPVPDDGASLDPSVAMLLNLDDQNPISHEELDPLVEEEDQQPPEESLDVPVNEYEDQFAGFDEFSSSSNYDFANDNFGF